MNINFPPVDERYIKSKVEAGYYINETEMIRDAVRKMREADQQPGNAVYEAIMVAEESVIAGRVKEYTPELEAQIRAEGRARAKSGKKLNPDVTGHKEQ